MSGDIPKLQFSYRVPDGSVMKRGRIPQNEHMLLCGGLSCEASHAFVSDQKNMKEAPQNKTGEDSFLRSLEKLSQKMSDIATNYVNEVKSYLVM